MSTLVDTNSLEAQISDCLQAIYQAPDPESAMRYWMQLNKLKAQRVEEEDRLFLRESRGVSTPHRMGSAFGTTDGISAKAS